jgi:hypothetical protein
VRRFAYNAALGADIELVEPMAGPAIGAALYAKRRTDR